MPHRAEKESDPRLVRPDVGRLLCHLGHPDEILCRIEVVEKGRVTVELIAEDDREGANFPHYSSDAVYWAAAVDKNEKVLRANPERTVVGLGEALFDIFGASQILGGATLNVAVHSNRLLSEVGGEGIVVSRVGDDDLGRQVRESLWERSMSDDYLQADPEHPTGQVLVTLDGAGQPTYDIVPGAAWDFIEFNPELAALASACGAVCFGTLAQREPASRMAIRQFVQAAPEALRLLDVNLRQQYYSVAMLRESVALANAVKLNEDELPVLLEAVGMQSVQQLQEQLDLRFVVLTRGARGTELITGDGTYRSAEVPRFEQHPQADAVGAGDACAAGILTGYLLDQSPQEMVELADRLGAYVASQPGATPDVRNAIQSRHR